jgi:methionyl-tRNA synthetase
LEKILVTSALTYANGPLHIGHVAGSYLNADIFVRYCKLKGKDVIYIGGTDDYGTPISIKAEEEGIEPRVIAERYNKSMKKDLDGLNIELDNFSGTSRPEHIKISQDFFTNLLEAGYVTKKTLHQFYDEKHKRFLADRYVEGVCPYCKSEGARGDQCDNCGKLIDSINLIDPKSKLSGEKPVIKETTHWYINLPKFENQLREWFQTKKYWKDNVLNFIMSWLNEGLIERAITRDLDWGIPIPLKNTEGKVLYVWFDAPIGPAMLSKQKDKYILPYDVPANEFLNLEGQKMSTSKNWTVWVKDYLEYFDGEYLRFYLAANAPETKDSDFYWKDFQNKINNDLNNVLGNLANRTFVFAKKYFDGKIEEELELSEPSQIALKVCKDTLSDVENSFNTYQVRKAVKSIIDVARWGNKYFDETKPWKEIKTNKRKANETLYICTELLSAISIALYPILPNKMLKLRKMLNLSGKFNWKNISIQQRRFIIDEVEPLFKKIEDAEIKKQLELLKATQIEEKEKMEHKPEITFEDFEKLEMRIVKVLEAENIPKSKKLLKLKVDIGGEERSVVAGISESYEPQELIGKKVSMLINLKPRKVMGVESQAMILAAEDDGNFSVLIPHKNVKEGSEIS